MTKYARVEKRVEISAAHWIPNHPGKCKNLHGHNYVLLVSVEGVVHPDTGMVVDFGDVKDAIRETVFEWDHSLLVPWEPGQVDSQLDRIGEVGCAMLCLTKISPIGDITTAENLANIAGRRIGARIAAICKFDNITVQVYETSDSSATAYVSWLEVTAWINERKRE